MADIKFSCPHCQQHMQAEPNYAGIQIACPSCNGSLVVPGTPSALAPAAAVVAPVPRPPPPAAPPLAVAGAASPAHAASSDCPSCGASLARGAVLCINCGYNLSTGQRIVAGRPAALGKPGTPQWKTAWYKTVYPYIALLFVVLGVLYFLGRQNPALMPLFLGVAALYAGIIHILVLVAAFQESVGTGFLTLCIPFYSIYFVFKVNDSDTLKLLFGVAVLVELAVGFMK